MDDTQRRITEICNALRDLLLEKNRKYGDAALNPKRIFSKASTLEQLHTRIDDKLSRIATSGTRLTDEDTLMDLAGYRVLLRIAEEREQEREVVGGYEYANPEGDAP